MSAWKKILGIGAVAGGLFWLSRKSKASEKVIEKSPNDKTPAKTDYWRIDAILDKLRTASKKYSVPLGLVIGWIARECAGKIEEAPKPLKGEEDSERGFMQQTPTESKSVGITDHKRLSTDVDYSIDGGMRLINHYASIVRVWNVDGRETSYFWRLVKLCHTIGSGGTKIIVNMAKEAGKAGSWDELEKFALDHADEIKAKIKHAPEKWFKLVDDVYRIGAPFGFST